MNQKRVVLDNYFLVVLAVGIFFLFSLLILRFFHLQVIEGERWTTIGQKQHKKFSMVPFERGHFFSNTSIGQSMQSDQPFVINVVEFHLFADPDAIPFNNKKEILQKIYQTIALDEKEKEFVASQLYKKSRCRKLIWWIDKNKRDLLEDWWVAYAHKHKISPNALYFIHDYHRSYPFGTMLGQVLHTVRDEVDPHNKQHIPTGGLEQSFDHFLRGKEGKKMVVHSPRHPLGIGEIIENSHNGADVYLTINHYLQAIAEEELKKGVEAVHAKGGWAVMMDPSNGHILAMAQYPFFDPREYRKYFNDPTLMEHGRVKPLMDAFEPGSIMKPVTMAICLKANQEYFEKMKKPLFDPNEKIATSDGHFPGRRIPITDLRGHKYLNMYMGIQKSSNIYMAKVIQRVISVFGDFWYRQALKDFGFGDKTGVELPMESPGMVPTPGKLYPSGKLEWSKATPYSLAIGYNILVSSMQILRCYGILANGGKDVHPTLIKKIMCEGKEIPLQRNVSSKQIIDPQSVSVILRALKFTTKMRGTAPKGDIPGYTEGGKTSSSEKIIGGRYSKDLHISSFVGIAPMSAPRFVLMVVIDEPEKKFVPGVGKIHHGGICAAPVFSKIAARSLQYLGVAPDDPFGYPYGDPRRDARRADWSLEVQNLHELYERWNHP
ncbi:MAG: penicillin-binding protein 2 [Parachlamydiales bacterium]|nr:penicillin-binding protein 2 [Parachlamydiales bacterium]